MDRYQFNSMDFHELAFIFSISWKKICFMLFIFELRRISIISWNDFNASHFYFYFFIRTHSSFNVIHSIKCLLGWRWKRKERNRRTEPRPLALPDDDDDGRKKNSKKKNYLSHVLFMKLNYWNKLKSSVKKGSSRDDSRAPRFLDSVLERRDLISPQTVYWLCKCMYMICCNIAQTQQHADLDIFYFLYSTCKIYDMPCLPCVRYLIEGKLNYNCVMHRIEIFSSSSVCI